MRLRIYCLLAMLWPVVSCFAQPSKTNGPLREITGNVRNKDGEALANANIIIGKTGRGTVTDAKGNFRLRGVTDRDVIQISLIGYQQQRIMVNNRSSLLVILEPAVNELDKVVVQAYGVTSQRLSTGNISRVTAEEIGKHPVMNAMQVLQGLVPGALVTNANGSASSSVKIEIRGRNTINPNMVSEPLYVVDGVPLTILNVSSDNARQYVNGSILSQGVIQSGIPSTAGSGQSPFFGINPDDIESIEVLKDADATAIYGSRASNGAILITTKKGKAGKTHSEISAYTGYNQVSRFYDLLDTRQYLDMRREALRNDGLPITVRTAPDLLLWDTLRYTNWQKYIWGGMGQRTSLQANLSGGNANTNFRTSAGYDYSKEVQTERGGNYRGSFSMNLNHKSLNQRFGFSLSALYTITSVNARNRPGYILLPPNAPPIYDKYGNLNFAGWGAPYTYFPFGSLLETYGSRTNFLNSNIRLSYEMFKGLTLTTSFGYNTLQNGQSRTTPVASQDPSQNPKGTLLQGSTYLHNLIIEPQVQYSSFVGKGHLTVLLGGTAQTNKTNALLNSGFNYTSDLLINTINSAPTKNISEHFAEYRYAGVFGRINYNWENKYLLNLNARRDGSSRFGPGRQFGNFGSVGGAWIVSEENWMKRLSFLSFAKLRASYGVTGSDQIGEYGFLSLWQIGGYFGSTGTYNSRVPVTPLGFSDSLLQWEVNRKMEAALLLGFLKDRITIEASWYRNVCGNQLTSFPTSAFTGFDAVTTNTPAKVQNSGWEFILSSKQIDGHRFKWSTKANLAINRNKLLDYPNLQQSPYKNRFVIGQSLNIGRFIHYTGIDPQTGMYTFEDVNHDGNITLGEDDIFFFNFFPKFDGGITNNFSYKNWELSVSFYFRKQLGYNILTSLRLPGSMSNQPQDVIRRWQKPGDITDIGKLTTLSTPNNNLFYNYSDAKVSDASFIRLKNLSLSWQLPEKMRKKAGMDKCRIYIQAENLFVITGYKGIDPETQSIGNMPPLRTVTVGLSFNF